MLLPFAYEAAGAVGARLSLLPLLKEGQRHCITRAKNAPREREDMFPRHCEERKRRPFFACCSSSAGFKSAEAPQREGGSNSCRRADAWIASRSLSSGAHSRDPLVRNDGGGLFDTQIPITGAPDLGPAARGFRRGCQHRFAAHAPYPLAGPASIVFDPKLRLTAPSVSNGVQWRITAEETAMTFLQLSSRLILLFEHDLFRKPVSTFRDHALRSENQCASCL